MFEFKNKVGLITGGAGGIGKALAREFLRNGCKAVAILDINLENGKLVEKDLQREFSEEQVMFIKTDVTVRSEFEEAFEKVLQMFKQLDIVVNNAGVLQEMHWEKCVQVNLQGCITGSLLALDTYFPKCSSSRELIILNVSSTWGIKGSVYAPVYTATKYGVIAFSKAISSPQRTRNLNLKVVVICPGSTETGLLTSRDQVGAEFTTAFNYSKDVLISQTPETLAEKTVEILRMARTGTIWVISEGRSMETQLPGMFSDTQ